MMGPEGEVTIRLALDEWFTMTASETHTLSATTRDALLNAEPSGLARVLTCSAASARELLRWCEAVVEGRTADDPEGAAVLKRAASNVRYAQWRGGEDPPSDPAGAAKKNP